MSKVGSEPNNSGDVKDLDAVGGTGGVPGDGGAEGRDRTAVLL